MASPRPTSPTCSPVLALILTAPSPTRSSPARFARIAGLWEAELGLLGVDDHIAIDGAPSGPLDLVDHLRQEPGAIKPVPFWIGVRIVLPDIAQAGRSQQRIGHRVTDHIGIGVPHQAPWMGDPKSSQDQWPTLAQPMCVMPDPDPHVQAPIWPSQPPGLGTDSRGRCLRKSPCLPGVRQNRSVFSAGWLSRPAILPTHHQFRAVTLSFWANCFKFCTK